MAQSVELIWLGKGTAPLWPLGQVWAVAPSPMAVQNFIDEHLHKTRAKAWLFWGDSAGTPRPEVIQHILEGPGHVWHAGLKLGMGGLPNLLNYVNPIWMMNCDPNPHQEATSWRLSLNACLILTDVLNQLGGIKRVYRSLEVAALDMGIRFIQAGVFIRNTPELVESGQIQPGVQLPLEDEAQFISQLRGQHWMTWGLIRASLNQTVSPIKAIRAWIQTRQNILIEPVKLYQHKVNGHTPPDARVSILIPTVERYPYLRVLLDQIRTQTIQPFEIIIVDQTPIRQRDMALIQDFTDLPIKLFYLNQAGQCSSRNLGLQHSSGDYILFIDDDVEITSNFIEHHLTRLHEFRAEVSSGVVFEPPLSAKSIQTDRIRASDVFPTNNTMIRREVLFASGLFDMAYDHLPRADGDLGMRVYLSGAVMVCDESTPILHHHAPRGGLRTHHARQVTRNSSRRKLFHRNLQAASEMYLARRYFGVLQANEMMLLSLLTTFSVRGNILRKAAKVLIGLVLLPNSIWRLYHRRQQALAMLETFPQIPSLETGVLREMGFATTQTPLHILSIGDLTRENGYEFAIDAIAAVCRAGLPVIYSIVGKGEYQEALVYAARQHHLLQKGNIRFFTDSSPEILRDLWYRADVYLHLPFDGNSIEILEKAQMAGITVVATAQEKLLGKMGVVVVPSHDPEAIAARLIEIVRSPILRFKLGQSAYNRKL
ncbi:MAG: glycosyltransferase [Chloroflexi bacterium]|nr:glycosyltransferase [Chloroflexota bacterium]